MAAGRPDTAGGEARRAAVRGEARRARRAGIHSARDAAPSGGLSGQLLAFGEELRGEGVAVGTSELLDALAAVAEVPWVRRETFRSALAATLAKSADDRETFDAVFDRFFFRATEEAALLHPDPDLEGEGDGDGEGDGPGGEGSGEGADDGQDGEGAHQDITVEDLRDLVARAIAGGADAGALGDLARLAIAAHGRGAGGSGVVGVDVQRIRRAMDLRPERQPQLPEDDPRREGLPSTGIRDFERALRRELERQRIAESGELPPARPLGDLARSLPTGGAKDLADVHKIVAQLKRRLRTQGNELRGRRRRTQVDVRATMRASLQTGGVPVDVRERPLRPRRPEIVVVCDVSTSVTSSSLFFLSVLHALHDAFRRMRSFVFIERISEVSELFERERDFKKVAEAISRDAGVADVSGYTDYGRVWGELLTKVQDDLHPRTTLIVLGDARTNGRDPAVPAFAQLADRAGRAFWLNPEPRLYWDYGDSVIARYARHCDVHECWTSPQLEGFVAALAGAPDRR